MGCAFALWVGACGLPVPEGSSLVPDPIETVAPEPGDVDGGQTDVAEKKDAGQPVAPVADAGVSDPDGCGPNGSQHGNHCHCDPGYIEVQLYCVAAPACTDDGHEDNDTDATATPWDVSMNGTPLTACVGDDDWYTVDAQRGQQLKVKIEFKHAQGDLDLALWSPSNYGQADAVSVGEADVEEIVFTTTEAGPHYILVLNGSTTVNAYSMTVEVK